MRQKSPVQVVDDPNESVDDSIDFSEAHRTFGELKSQLISLTQERNNLQDQLARIFDQQKLNNEREHANSDGSREISLRKRIAILESVLDQQDIRNEQLLADKVKIGIQLSSKLTEKDALISDYQSQVNSLQTDLRNVLFSVDESAHVVEIQKLQSKLHDTQAELLNVKRDLEISQLSRQQIHETSMAILKETHSEASKLAIEHQARSMGMIFNHLDKEISDSHTECKSKVRRLELLLASKMTAEQDKIGLEHQLKILSSQKEALQKELAAAKDAWQPARREYDALSVSIQQIEQQMQPTPQISHEEWTSLIGLLEEKDSQIRGFESEMLHIVEGIGQLRTLNIF